jgi:hypothetical protein
MESASKRHLTAARPSEGGVCGRMADRSLGEVRLTSVPHRRIDAASARRVRLVLRVVRFPAGPGSVAARWPSPLPSCRSPFPVRLQGLPTEACPRVSVQTSARSPSPRVRRARRATGPPGATRRARTHATNTPHGPASLGLDPSKSPSPAPRWVTPGTSPASRHEVERPIAAPSGHGCQATASRSVHVVLRHLDGFHRTAGSGLVASRYRTWGSLRFTVRQVTAAGAAATGGRAVRSRRKADRPGSSQRRPFEGLILAGSRARISAAVALLPFLRARNASDAGRSRVPHTGEGVGDGFPTGPRRTRPHGRSLRMQMGGREPRGPRPSIVSWMWRCREAPRGSDIPHLPVGRERTRVAT